jgi:hypothetical protein
MAPAAPGDRPFEHENNGDEEPEVWEELFVVSDILDKFRKYAALSGTPLRLALTVDIIPTTPGKYNEKYMITGIPMVEDKNEFSKAHYFTNQIIRDSFNTSDSQEEVGMLGDHPELNQIRDMLIPPQKSLPLIPPEEIAPGNNFLDLNILKLPKKDEPPNGKC